MYKKIIKNKIKKKERNRSIQKTNTITRGEIAGIDWDM
jgi:hypothetical protein